MRATFRILALGLLVLVPYGNASAQSPVLSPIVDVTLNADTTATVNVVAIDLGEREISLLSSLPTFGRLNAPQAGVGELVTTFTLEPTALEVGTYTAALTATVDGRSAIEFFRVRVNPAGSPQAPIVTAPPLRVVEAGSRIQFTVDVNDPDGAGITSLVASALPGATTLDRDPTNSSGTFSWSPDVAHVGEYDVIFSALAANGLSGGAVTHIRVREPSPENHPPVLAADSTATVVAGSTLRFDVVATDPDGDRVDLFGDQLPAGASFVDGGDGTGTFTWSPDPMQAGVHEVSITGDDGRGGTATVTTMVTVVGVDVPDNCPRGLGFWRAQCAQRGNGSTKFDATQMEQIAARVDASSALFDWDEALDGLRSVIDPPRPLDIRKQTLRMYAVLLANVGAGELGFVTSQGEAIGLDRATEIEGPCLEGASTISDVMAEAESRLAELDGASLRSGTVSAYERLKKCIEKINDGIGIGPTCSADDEAAFQSLRSDRLNSSVHPNPLNPSTELSFRLSREGKVRVSVYDLQGRLVKTLVDERRSTGEQRVRWDGSNSRNRTVPSGVYFFRIQTPEGEVTRRATVVK